MRHKVMLRVIATVIFFTLSVTLKGEVKPRLERPVAIGASVTDGFDLHEFDAVFRRPKSIALALPKHLDAALTAEHGRFLSYGHRLLLADVEKSGALQVKLALEQEPTVLFAVDFLFWFVYGYVGSEEARLQRLEKGFTLIEQFDCPVVVGNFPDASGAVGRMIHRSQMPELATLRKANGRLKEWLAERENVVAVDLETVMRKAVANEAITMGRVQLAAGTTRDFIQKDGLHPTLKGARMIALLALQQLVERGDLQEQDVDWAH